jgi:hypothetical protein
MIDTIYRVGTWGELFALPDFVRGSVHRDLMTKGVLVGDYEMSPREGMKPCGIEECETDHRYGFIVRMPDNRLSHVGRYCGKKHFGENWNRVRKALSVARKQIAKEQAIVELKVAIQAMLDSWPAFDSAQLRAARSALAEFDQLPEKLRSTLEIRASEGDVAVPGWRAPTEDEKKKAKFLGLKKLDRITFERGPLQGLRGIYSKTRVDDLLDRQSPALVRAAKSLIADPDADSEALNSMRRRLLSFPGEVESSLRKLHAFLDNNNLMVATYLLAAQDLGIEELRYEATDAAGFVIRYKGQ